MVAIVESKRVLLVFANPRGTDSLRLGEEDKAIREAIRRANCREVLEVPPSCFAATIRDVRRALLDQAFDIVHFSGHGTRKGLVFENDQGEAVLLPSKALAILLGAYPTIQCVILNACYSLQQGELIATGKPYTIAMDLEIQDRSAIEFARGFYDGIGAGTGYERAYEEGCNAVLTELNDSSFLCKLLKGSQVQVSHVDSPQETPAVHLKEVHMEASSRTVEVTVTNGRVRLGVLEVRNNTDAVIADGLRGKLCAVRASDYRLILLDGIVLPAFTPYATIQLGPYIADLTQDMLQTEGQWQLEFYVTGNDRRETLLYRSPPLSIG